MTDSQFREKIVAIRQALELSPNQSLDLSTSGLSCKRFEIDETSGNTITRDYKLMNIEIDKSTNLTVIHTDNIHKNFYLKRWVLTDAQLIKLTQICVDTNLNLTFEYCPHCECEAIIPYKMEMAVCNHCGKPLAPCSVCMDQTDNCDCSNCKFNNRGVSQTETETLIYIVDYTKTSYYPEQLMCMKEDDFVALAEKQGTIFSLQGFVRDWNIYQTIPNPIHSIMRMFDVPKTL